MNDDAKHGDDICTSGPIIPCRSSITLCVLRIVLHPRRLSGVFGILTFLFRRITRVISRISPYGTVRQIGCQVRHEYEAGRLYQGFGTGRLALIPG